MRSTTLLCFICYLGSWPKFRKVTLICILILHFWLVWPGISCHWLFESHAFLVGNSIVLFRHSIFFYKPGWQTSCQLHFYILVYHLRYLYLLNLLIVYRVTFLVRLNWFIDWLVYKTDKLIKHIKYY